MKNLKDSKELFQSLESRLDGVEWHGHYFAARCLFHDDTRPSMFVYPDYFKCSACGEQGRLEKLERKVSGTTTPKLDQPTKYHGPPWNKWLEKYKNWDGVAHGGISNAIAFPSLMSYITKRGIDWKRYKIGWLDNFFTIPVYNEHGSVVDFVVRSNPKSNGAKYVLRPHKKDEFNMFVPNWERVLSADMIYFDFVGILDALSMDMAGFPVITGLNGQDPIEKYAEKLKEFRVPIVVVADVGEEERAKKFVRLLGWRGKYKPLFYPEGCKDRNDIHRQYGLKKLQSLILH